MKTYSSKATAKKGAKRQGLNVDELTFLADDEGRWYWEEATVEDMVAEVEEIFETNADLEDKMEAALDLNDILVRSGIKIEKERPERNGIVRPSEGGKCRAIWDACDAMNAKGTIPMPKLIKELAVANGWNENNAVIEMYQWRKFMGINGRQK